MPIRDTISLLENRLAARALHHVCEEGQIAPLAVVREFGIDDVSVLRRLRAMGHRPRRQILRVLHEVTRHLGIETDDAQLFDRVDDYLRGGLNPLNQMVQSLIEATVREGRAEDDGAAPTS